MESVGIELALHIVVRLLNVLGQCEPSWLLWRYLGGWAHRAALMIARHNPAGRPLQRAPPIVQQKGLVMILRRQTARRTKSREFLSCTITSLLLLTFEVRKATRRAAVSRRQCLFFPSKRMSVYEFMVIFCDISCSNPVRWPNPSELRLL